MSATRLAINNCCLRWRLCINCNTAVESEQKLQLFILISCSLTLPLFLQNHCHDFRCNTSCDIKRCLIGVTLQLPKTNIIKADHYFGCERRLVTALIVSSDASVLSLGPLQSLHWRTLCIGVNIDMLCAADWIHVFWDCFRNCIVVT